MERARLDKMLANNEITSLIKAMGVGIDEQFHLDGLRYERIIIMTDADVDGSHIRTLLLTFFFRHMQSVVEGGHIYIAQPPLFKIAKGKSVQYAYTDEEKDKILQDLVEKAQKKADEKEAATKALETSDQTRERTAAFSDEEKDKMKMAGVNISRYKGLGEMDADQLWDTTMNPENRVLLQVTLQDTEAADAVFNKLMGTEVELRKNFIQSRAKQVRELDI